MMSTLGRLKHIYSVFHNIIIISFLCFQKNNQAPGMNSQVTKRFKVLLAFAVQWQVATYSTEAVQTDAISNQQCNSESFRSSFVLTMTEKTLLGNVVKEVIAEDLLSCNHACLRETWCVSTNFYSSRTCKLNNKAFSESKTKSLLLVPMKSSVYSEIKRSIVS